MDNRLQEIKALKLREVATRHVCMPTPRRHRHMFKRMLTKPGLSVIAEVKRASPSAGLIATIDDPAKLAGDYIQGGARAISVLTDMALFQGSISDLKQVAESHPSVPVLRKDFVVHPCQIYEAVHAGASAILLIVSLLGDKTGELLTACHHVGIEALVEVHTVEELELALAAGATIIGVNNRNLKTLKVDLTTAERLAHYLPEGVIKIAESGIRNRQDAARMYRCGYDAVLIGEALVRAESPQALVREMGESPSHG